ncbi:MULTISPECIES: ionic transporter y4hA [Burkholderia]|uniref:Ionic transporter y4hA n=1 Tax=Burkholderia humptydooensis TaxID=430531 RepID=A0A7U4PA78_9BURK|nr:MULTISPECIES: ionic transporter y4hA [Burkholderia]AGK50034.1 sodium/calcium exchanger family protein [Burkholderia thailandensis MSMB121]ATF32797.1 ionic transporter y4hA [Burkholderia thailandensis]AJY39543.1 sodium/calcium exchanger family protein [Burkholderia sp. 2002721687]ALX45819.1 ionic transporter y4hA [Burkholderia humptydooensis]KST71023.1 ionic transporter y4hA [Burkholderia humptydooensis]
MPISSSALPRWTLAAPLAAWLVLALSRVVPAEGFVIAFVAAALAGAVFSAVHHAEVVAHRVGEPFGTLVLAIAVTVIEVALIVSVMLSAGPEKAGLARDTVFAAVMIVCNGIVGLCLLVGGWKHGEQDFQGRGATKALAVLASLSVLSLVMPNYLSAAPGPRLSTSQLAFAGVSSLVLYGVFVFVQTVRHRDYFLIDGSADESIHAVPPSGRTALTSIVFLFVSLVAVVLLAKLLSPAVERTVLRLGAPEAAVGIVIAALVLLPEGLAAVGAARANRLQTSMNLALGSALASIGLTIPTVAAVFIWTGNPLTLGIGAMETVLLSLTLLVSTLTLSMGRTTVLHGVVHLSLFAAYLFLSVTH